MPHDVYILGRGLASAAGADLAAALESIRAGTVIPGTLCAAPGIEWPYFAIPEDHDNWYTRARSIVSRVVTEAGPNLDRQAPLFVASSSLNVGALEAGAPFLRDCQTFVEQVASWIEWRGPVYWVSTACTSAVNAILGAKQMIRCGAADHALVLGMELHNAFSCAGFGGMQLLDTHTPRPLALDRNGIVLGEAVAALYLGNEKARWRLRGGANIVDGSSPAGATRAAVNRMVSEALTDSASVAGEIGLVKVQAAGSVRNDAEEIEGLREQFGVLPPLATLKTSLGHTLGAAGAAELVLLTAAIEAGVWPRLPPLSFDPEIEAVCTGKLPRVRLILANILGFGGGHAGVVVEDTLWSAA